MLKIRLQRKGKRGQAYFKVVVTEHTTKPQGKYLELLGSYDPHKNEITVNAEKVREWLGKGAKMSGTVNNLLVGRGIIQGEKVRVWKPKNRGNIERPGANTTETPPLRQTGLGAGQTQKGQETQKEETPTTDVEKNEEKTEELAPEMPKEEIEKEKKEEPKSEEPSPVAAETPAA